MKNYKFQYFRLFVIHNNINRIFYPQILSTYIDLFYYLVKIISF